MGHNGVDPVLCVPVGGADAALLHLFDDGVDKGKAGAVRRLNGFPAGHVHVALDIGGLLRLPCPVYRRFDNLRQALAAGGNGVHHRAAQRRRQGCVVNPGFLLFVHVRLVQRNDHGNPQFQQLGGEEEAAAQVGCVHDIYQHVGPLVPNILAGDAFLAGEGGHRICAGQIHGNQVLPAAGIGLSDDPLLAFHRHARPVADLFRAAGQRIVHRCFATVGVSRQCDSHTGSSLKQGCSFWSFFG